MGENVPLPGCIKDVEAMQKKLADCGFRVTSRFDLTQSQMFHEFSSFLNKTKSNDTLLFYFSGHGVEYKGLQYFIPVGMDDPEYEQDIVKTAFSCDHAIQIMMEKVKKQLKIIISDACRSEFKMVLRDIGSRTGNTYDSINIEFDPNKTKKEYEARSDGFVIGQNLTSNKSVCSGFDNGQPNLEAVFENALSTGLNSTDKHNIVRMCAVSRGEMADAGQNNDLSYYTKSLTNNMLNWNQSILRLNIKISENFRKWGAKPEIAIIAPDETVNTFRFRVPFKTAKIT